MGEKHTAGPPRDEQGRTAYDIIRDFNQAHPPRTPTTKAAPMFPPRGPREPLLGPPADMTVSRVLLELRPDMDPTEADRLAVAINDALASLPTPEAKP